MQNITLSGIKFRVSLLWSQFASSVNLKPSVSSLLIFLGVCFSLPVQAHSFNEEFDSDPTTGAFVPTFSIAPVHLVTFKFTFTTDGDRGTFAYDTANGENGSASISMVSNTPGPGIEQITIARNDGEDFPFNSIFIHNFSDVITIRGYNGGALVGVTQMASATLPAAETLSFGGIVVDEIRLTSADFNANIDSFNSEALSSPPVNTAPTGSVTISGTASEGQTLTASNTLADADGLGAITYQWKRGVNDIPGETLATYILVQDDVGEIISVIASYTDGQGTLESVPSAATAAVTNVNDAPTGSVTISGTASEGQTLTASNTLADVDGLGAITYQWKRDVGGVVSDVATGTTYVLTQTDVGSTITVTASYTDGGNTVESVSSVATAIVTNVNNAPTGSVTINGAASEGQTLTASNTLADADGLGAITYQWKRDVGGAVSDVATGTTYVLTQADVGSTITVTANYTDGGMTAESVPSAATATVINVNNAPTGSVTISGTASEGQTLTASNTLADIDVIPVNSIVYQWKRGVNDIPGEILATYVLVQDDVGEIISVIANYTDGGNTSESVPSAATAAVTNVNDAPTGSVIISGIVTEGEILTVSNTLMDEDGIGSISYQWSRNGSDILSATGETYILMQDDVGSIISVTANYTDAGNFVESVISSATAAVVNVNDIGVVTVSGLLDVGQMLTAFVADDDGTDDATAAAGGFSYQWKRDGSDIAGEAFKDYILVAADIGRAITVTVNYTDDEGTSESVTGSATGSVSDMTPPVITTPAPITVTAEGLFTLVDIGLTTANDNADGVLTPTSDAPSHFVPGITLIFWEVEDAAGNMAMAIQSVTVKPLVDFSVDQLAAENTGVNGTSFRIYLNGKVSYDVDVPYTVSGTANGSDHDLDLANGVAKIIAGRDVAEVSFTINDDGLGEGVETIVVTMGTPTPDAAVGTKSILNIDITEENIAPVVSLSAIQATIKTRTITLDSGVVTVSSDATDPNTTDTLTYDWSATDNTLMDIDSDVTDGIFIFDPSSLSPGSYVLRLTVNDGTAAAETELLLNIFSDAQPADLIADSDNDGIPDSRDSGDKTNILPSLAGLFTSGLLEIEAGLVFGLGDTAFTAGKGQAKVTMADVNNVGQPSDIGFAYPSGLFDFDIEGLGAAGQSVNIVLPQQKAIPTNATYRKLVANNWQEFVIDDNNAIATAPGTPGFCPPPGDAQYQAGLTKGHFCVQLTIEDGGVNDGDGAANNRISDPSGVAITAAVPPADPPAKSDNSNGIFGLGRLSIWWLSLFALFGLRNLTNRKVLSGK